MRRRNTSINSRAPDRLISMGEGLASVPERLLLAHAQGKVLFIVGAGASQPAGLPSFRGLVIGVYGRVDRGVYDVLTAASDEAVESLDRLTDQQKAEVDRFRREEYDVVLGMLERRMDERSDGGSRVREAVATELRREGVAPAPIHRALMRLADRGGSVAIVTTNFELLLQKAAEKSRDHIQTYALGGIPRPGHGADFAGVMHIHGALDVDPRRTSDFVLTDQDFGEFYLRRRTVPDFIYDAARLYNLVLVGYSANDPPMRYLLNAIAADGFRFDDLKERFTFVGGEAATPVALEDWKARGITPIKYEKAHDHVALRETLERWAELSAVNGKIRLIDRELKRIVKSPRDDVFERDRDLFDHLVRRADATERYRIAAFISKCRADIGWLDAIATIVSENTYGE
jgi:hypothetical protein